MRDKDCMTLSLLFCETVIQMEGHFISKMKYILNLGHLILVYV